MANRSPHVSLALAKITAPGSRRALLRHALFERLDDCTDQRLSWVCAPAGYGKTTAVVTYLGTLRKTFAWYQCDAGDADIASFFHYVNLAFRGVAGVRAPALPDFSAQTFAAVPAFARAFFRAWFSCLPEGAVWVLDNWQDVPAESMLAELLPLIAGEIPQGMRLIVISRAGPAMNLIRLVAAQAVQTLGEQDLRLTREETAALVATYTPPANQNSVLEAEELFALTDGWAAGVILMLRHDARTAPAVRDRLPRSVQGAFSFLTSEVFDNLSEDVRAAIVRTACLGHVSVPVAEHMLGRTGVRDMLEMLVNQNAFTTYRPASDTFHFHPLFHQFLRDQLDARVDRDAQRVLYVAAAEGLAQENDVQQAIHLFLLAGDWTRAVSLIAQAAPGMAQQARFMTLLGWIQQLPPAVSDASAWTCYWTGLCQLAIDFPAARPSLERAHELFVRAEDSLGQMLAAAAILQHIAYCYVEFSSMRPWIDRLSRLLADNPFFPSPSIELQVRIGLLLALSQAQPTHADMRRCVDRVTELLDAPVDLASSAAGVAALLHFFGGCGDVAGFRAFDQRVESLLKRPELAPGARIDILWVRGYQCFLRGFGTEATGLLDAADAIAREHGLVAFELRTQASRLQMMDPRQHRAELLAAFAGLAPMLARAPVIASGHVTYLQAMFRLAIGDASAALRDISETAARFDASGWVIASAMAQIGKADILVELDRCADAEALLDRLDQALSGLDAPVLRFNSGLVRAELARRRRPAEFASLLSDVLAIGRLQGYVHSFHAYGVMLPRLIPHALSLGIEVEYCRQVIVRRALTPPLADIPHWPWPVRIRAMGHLEILVDGDPVEFQGRPQRKPVDLLKLLLTGQAGLETTRIMDALWPAVDGDAARNSFDLALYRLRKLLKHKDGIVLNQGRLSLHPSLVWVDAFALARLSGEGAAPQDPKSGVAHLMTLYRAPFLAGEEGAEVFGARVRLRSQFIRSVATIAEQLNKAQEWDVMVTLCRQALEVEPLEEALYRIWIRSLLAQGHRAEAEAVYRRCEQTFSALLHSRPSRTTAELLSVPGSVCASGEDEQPAPFEPY